MTLGYFTDASPERHAAEAARQAIVLLDARDAPAGQMPVVLAPGDSGILLHEAVGHGLEADFNRKGTSNYTGQVGKAVASELCTVVDDPSLLGSRGSINVDDEGMEPTRSVLIEDGVLRGYMQDRLSARHFGVRPTGNGRRESFACVPMPRMTNTVLLAGPHDPEEVVRSVKRGIFAKTFGGGQVDISNGCARRQVADSSAGEKNSGVALAGNRAKCTDCLLLRVRKAVFQQIDIISHVPFQSPKRWPKLPCALPVNSANSAC